MWLSWMDNRTLFACQTLQVWTVSMRSANSSNICFLDGLHRYVSNGTIELGNFCFGVKPFVDPEVGCDEWDHGIHTGIEETGVSTCVQVRKIRMKLAASGTYSLVPSPLARNRTGRMPCSSGTSSQQRKGPGSRSVSAGIASAHLPRFYSPPGHR
jgi:hypothetical protein